jgi:hypothetical protein
MVFTHHFCVVLVVGMMLGVLIHADVVSVFRVAVLPSLLGNHDQLRVTGIPRRDMTHCDLLCITTLVGIAGYGSSDARRER